MALAHTYNSLVASVEDWIVDSSDEFVAALPDMIGRAEQRILLDLPLTIFEVTANGAFTPNSRVVAKPPGYLWVADLWVVMDTGAQRYIEPRSPSYAQTFAPNPASTGTPRFHYEDSEGQLLVVPTPASALAWILRHGKRPDGLTAANQTTWLGSNVADLLHSAVMIEAEAYILADEDPNENNRVKNWAGDYQARLEQARRDFASLLRVRYP